MRLSNFGNSPLRYFDRSANEIDVIELTGRLKSIVLDRVARISILVANDTVWLFCTLKSRTDNVQSWTYTDDLPSEIPFGSHLVGYCESFPSYG